MTRWPQTVFATLTLSFSLGFCATTELKSVPSPSGFCQRVENPPLEPLGRVTLPWANWVGHVLGNFDCTCPGGKYYGKNDPLCRAL